MNCPKWGLPMEEGSLHTQKYPVWTRQELRLFRGSSGGRVEIGPADGGDTSLFTRDPFPAFPGAMLCRACGLACFSGKLIGKSNTKSNTEKE